MARHSSEPVEPRTRAGIIPAACHLCSTAAAVPPGSRTTACASRSSGKAGTSPRSSTRRRASTRCGRRPGHRSSRRNTTAPGILSMAAASTRRCSPGSWGTTCASTSSADRRMPKPRPGLPVHGEASLVRYELEQSGQTLVQRARLPLTNLRVERRIQLAGPRRAGRGKRREPVGVDRPVGWTRARHARPAVSREGRDRVSRLGLALEGVRARLRQRRLSRARRRVRLAPCAPRPAAAPPTCGVERRPQRRAPTRLT